MASPELVGRRLESRSGKRGIATATEALPADGHAAKDHVDALALEAPVFRLGRGRGAPAAIDENG